VNGCAVLSQLCVGCPPVGRRVARSRRTFQRRPAEGRALLPTRVLTLLFVMRNSFSSTGVFTSGYATALPLRCPPQSPSFTICCAPVAKGQVQACNESVAGSHFQFDCFDRHQQKCLLLATQTDKALLAFRRQTAFVCLPRLRNQDSTVRIRTRKLVKKNLFL
jgi:hypothetical protein